MSGAVRRKLHKVPIWFTHCLRNNVPSWTAAREQNIMNTTVAAIIMLAGLSVGLPMSGAASAPSPVVRPGIPVDESVQPIRIVVPKARRCVAGRYAFVPLNLFRALDSRDYSDGYLLAGQTWAFDVITDQKLNQQIPAGAVAVTYNLTVTDTTSTGYIAVYPADIVWPGTSSVNWTAPGTTLANGGTVAVGLFNGPGEVEVHVGPAGGLAGTDFVMDITGYYI